MKVNSTALMDGPADITLARSLRGVPLLIESPTLNFHQGSVDSKGERCNNRFGISGFGFPGDKSAAEGKEISMSFKNVINNYPKSAASQIQASPELERMTDAINRSERLLLADGNNRERSKTKTFIYMADRNQEFTKLPRSTQSAKGHKTTAISSVPSFSAHVAENKKEFIVNTPVDDKVQEENDRTVEVNISNNAVNETNGVSVMYGNRKKGKKTRKRPKSSLKCKRVKQGRVSVPTTGYHHTNYSSPRQPARASSEPSSKTSPYLSYTHVANTTNKPPSTDSRPNHKVSSGPSKHQLITGIIAFTGTSEDGISCLQVHAQSKPLLSQAVDNERRIRSGASGRSEHVLSANSNKELCITNNQPVSVNQFTLTAKALCSANSPEVVCGQNQVPRQKSSVSSSKESSLVAIYGPNSRQGSQNDELKKLRKIFLSEKQSGSIKDCGVDMPCAPPATPTPDVLKKYEFVPSMNDIRSQQAVRNRLKVMERDAQKRQEKQKEARVKLEKQQIKDREKNLKAQQRLEIYALNKVMTELEHKRFLEFCAAKGLNT